MPQWTVPLRDPCNRLTRLLSVQDDTAGQLATWTNPASTGTTYGYDNARGRTAGVRRRSPMTNGTVSRPARRLALPRVLLARIARNVRPGAGVIIDINRPRPLPPLIPVLSSNTQGPSAVSATAGTSYGTCLVCALIGLSVSQRDVEGGFQPGLVFYDWDNAKVVAASVTAVAGVRVARNLRPGSGIVIDIDKPKPKPSPLPPLYPVPV